MICFLASLVLGCICLMVGTVIGVRLERGREPVDEIDDWGAGL